MKTKVRNILKVMLTLSAAGLIFSAFTLLHSNGSPGGYTGSPGDGKTCVQCHGGTATTQAGIITSDVPPIAGYTPGANYTITVTVPGSADLNKGFEVSPQNATGTLLGTLTAGSGSQLVNSSKSVTQTTPEITGPAVWTFTWKAPVAGTGNVTFYGAFVSGYSTVLTSTMTVSEHVSSSINAVNQLAFNIYPNPVRDRLDVTFSLAKRATVSFTILSIDGKKITDISSVTLPEGNHKQSFDVRNKLSHGVYNLVLNVDGNISTKKFLVE